MLVSAGASRLLEIVLQRAGYVRVNHQAHIGLIDAHAKRVGRDDDLQLSADEALLDVLLGFRLEAGMKEIGSDVPWPRRKLGNLLLFVDRVAQ